jgi:glucokinase
MTNSSIGVDLGGTNLRIAVVDPGGRLLEKVSLDTDVARGKDYAIGRMCEEVRRLQQKYQNAAALPAVGVGVPGIIDMRTGLLRGAENLPGWTDFHVGEEIEKGLGRPVFLENDANVAALGEKWLGASREVDDMAMFTLGTGVGGAIVLGGRIWHGMTGMAGEFGHMTVEPGGVLCTCGSQGCLEMYASATAIVRLAREAMAAGPAPGLARAAGSDQGLSAKAVCDLARNGDEDASAVVGRAGRYLGIGIANMVTTLNLPMYVIGGGVSRAWDLLAPPVFEQLQHYSLVYAATKPASPGIKSTGAGANIESRGPTKTIVVPAELGGDAGLYGAARLAMMSA